MAEYAWNGLGVVAPDTWEPAAIERDGLTFAESGKPVCELKWNRVRGSFSFEKHIRKLTKTHKDAAVSSVTDEETPSAWSAALKSLAESGLRSRSFIWQAPGVRGIGAALHNPGTGLAVLVQFFIHAEPDEDRAADILASLRDYSGGKSLPWTMFGVTARVPSEFVLDTFSFQPGHYRVLYWRPKSGTMSERVPPGKGPGTQLTFERFAPASVLLRQTSLAEWIAKTVKETPDIEAFASQQSRAAWNTALKTSLLRKTLRREVYSQGRAWVTDTGNAILSVCVSGTVPAPEIIFADICGSYALVQEEIA
ncbi:hypothetical protein [uncultured Pseudodesulfovibrio sp.]|uniref:hypothetical protein n=1 Tax=uncultured Pseudodesulfovibrio sp. TaxID=2035858 RepID=UPI0029C78D45|nr:hypothetical protein [uncultured Pseudodesulfovibrio sp.]